MTTALTLPQARIPIGTATIQGQQVPIFVTIDWMLAFAGLLSRSGGTSGDTSFEQYINQFYDAPLASTESQQATRAIEEMRNELESTRSDLNRLRGEFEQLQNEPRMAADLRNRLDTLEDRLA